MIESLLAKIAAAVFKSAAIGSVVSKAAAAYEMYTLFDGLSETGDCVYTTNDCDALETYGVTVLSDHVGDTVADKLIQINNHSFTVEKTKSGIYIASSLTPRFSTSSLVFPSFSRREFQELSEKSLKKPNW